MGAGKIPWITERKKLRLVMGNELKLLIQYSQEVREHNCCCFFA